MHRNTYIDSPRLLDAKMRLKTAPQVRFAGQITGVEGYVESTAHGLLTGLIMAHELLDKPFTVPPPTTALGALYGHVRGLFHLHGRMHEPQNINWSMFEPLGGIKRKEMKEVRRERAQVEFGQWLSSGSPSS